MYFSLFQPPLPPPPPPKKKMLYRKTNRLSDSSKLKPLADDKFIVTKNVTEVFLREKKKTCGKRIKCWLRAFSLFPTMFSNNIFPRVVKSREFFIIIPILTLTGKSDKST